MYLKNRVNKEAVLRPISDMLWYQNGGPDGKETPKITYTELERKLLKRKEIIKSLIS